MFAFAAAVALTLAGGAATGVTVEALADGRYRLSTAIGSSVSPTAHAEAQIRLMREPRRLCRSTGRPVSDGVLELSRVPAQSGTRNRLVISETYSCVAG
jgi:hypothetical protein